MKKILTTLLGSVIVGALAFGAPAEASVSDCTNYAGTFCLWKNAGAGGAIWRQTPAQVSTSCTSLVPFGWNDVVTSARNNASGKVMELYWDSNCSGDPIDVLYGYTYDLTGNAWNNKVSGISWRYV